MIRVLLILAFLGGCAAECLRQSERAMPFAWKPVVCERPWSSGELCCTWVVNDDFQTWCQERGARTCHGWARWRWGR